MECFGVGDGVVGGGGGGGGEGVVVLDDGGGAVVVDGGGGEAAAVVVMASFMPLMQWPAEPQMKYLVPAEVRGTTAAPPVRRG